jgi:hypothetical protein
MEGGGAQRVESAKRGITDGDTLRADFWRVSLNQTETDVLKVVFTLTHLRNWTRLTGILSDFFLLPQRKKTIFQYTPLR